LQPAPHFNVESLYANDHYSRPSLYLFICTPHKQYLGGIRVSVGVSVCLNIEP